MSSYRNTTRKRLQQRRGGVLILIALFLVIMVAMAAFSIDLAYIQLTKTQLRAAADSAAKAGAATLRNSQDPSQAINTAINIAAKNTVNGKGFALSPSDIELGQSVSKKDGTWEFVVGKQPYQAMRINAKLTNGSAAGPVNAIFGKIFGQDKYQLNQTAVASQYEQQVVLCLDRSHSMCFDLSGIDWVYPKGFSLPKAQDLPPQIGSRWNSLEQAITNFLDVLETSSYPPEVALVTWGSDTTVSVWENLNGVMIKVKKNFKAMEVDKNLTTEYKDIEKAVLKRGDQVMPGSTNMSAGLDGAIDVLTASKKPMAKKTIILMTDGLWNQGVDPVVSAQRAKTLGITVHTITFLPGADQTTMVKIASMTGGKHYFAIDQVTLLTAFEELAKSLPVVLTE